MRKGILAMEGLEETVEREVIREEAEFVEDNTAFVDAPEGDLVQADAALGEMDVLDDQIGEAAVTADALTEVAGEMEETLDEGGLSRAPARSLELAVERLCLRAGIDVKEAKIFPAMEGFADQATRVRYTKIALENVLEKGKEIWRQIVAVCQKAIEWLVKFYKHITDGAKRLQERGLKLEEVAKAMRGTEPKAGSHLSVVGWGNVLQSQGRLPEGLAVHTALQKNMAQTDALNKAQIALAKDGQEGIVKILGLDDASAAGDVIAGVWQTMAKYAPKRVSANRDLGGKGYEVREEALVFGDQSFYATLPVGQTEDAGQSMSWTVADSAGRKEVQQLPPVRPLSAKEAEFVISLVIGHLASYNGFTEQVKSIKQTADAAVKASQSQHGSDEVAKATQKLVRSYVSMMTSGSAKLRSYDLSVCKAALDYAGASLKALRGEDDIQVL